MLLRLLLLALVVAAMPVTAEAAMGDEVGDPSSVVSGGLADEEAAADADSGGDLPCLLSVGRLILPTPDLPQGHGSAMRFTPVEVIHQTTRAPPLL